jgi:iron complex outermembrane receptor protein
MIGDQAVRWSWKSADLALVLAISAAPLAAQPADVAALPAPLADVAALPAPPVAATGSRADENPVRQAGDAFGTSIGRETIGLYNQSSVRGFSPVAAGNVRIDGLYFDPVIIPTNRISRATTIRVGLSALGNPFPAPTGLVDFGFRRPGDAAAASLLVGIDGWGTLNAELDASLPVSSRLSLGFGASVLLEDSANATIEKRVGGALSARWAPTETLTLVPFVNVTLALYDDHGAIYIPATDTLPPLVPRRVLFGPEWVNGHQTEINMGLLADWEIGSAWMLRAGLFRSSQYRVDGMTNIVREVRPDGSGLQRVLVDPPLDFASLSGEVRLTRRIDDGPRRHLIHAAVRGRAGDRRFGGADMLELGPASIYQPSTVPKPVVSFGPQQEDRVRQWTGGLAYEGRWEGAGELSAGLQYSDYRKRIDLPAGGVETTEARPLLYNITLAADLSDRLVVYAGAVTGLEESGVAPGNAANRNEALPAIRTRQFDAGLRFAITPQIKLVAGVFEVSKPYFNLDASNRFAALGDVINRGIEASVAGPLTPTLSMVAGAVLLQPRVTGEAVDAGRIGNRPVGAISRRFEASLDWRPHFLPGVSFDTRIAYRSEEISTVSNLTAIPARSQVNLGGRYRFRAAGRSVLLRLQATNLFDVQGYELRGADVYNLHPGRLVQGYMTVDF